MRLPRRPAPILHRDGLVLERRIAKRHIARTGRPLPNRPWRARVGWEEFTLSTGRHGQARLLDALGGVRYSPDRVLPQPSSWRGMCDEIHVPAPSLDFIALLSTARLRPMRRRLLPARTLWKDEMPQNPAGKPILDVKRKVTEFARHCFEHGAPGDRLRWFQAAKAARPLRRGSLADQRANACTGLQDGYELTEALSGPIRTG